MREANGVPGAPGVLRGIRPKLTAISISKQSKRTQPVPALVRTQTGCFDSHLETSDMRKESAVLLIAAMLPFGLLMAQDQDQQGPVEKTENTAKKVAHKTGETVKNGVKATGSAISNGAKATERTVGKGLEKTGNTIRKAGTNPTPVRHHRPTTHASPASKESPVNKPSPSPEQSTTPQPAASPTP